MMIANYNPFDKKNIIETEHGVINFSHDMGVCYVTHRNEAHIFRKYKGFGVSLSELEVAYKNNVYWLLIVFHKNNGTNTALRIRLNHLKYLEHHDNDGDTQIVIPLKYMQSKGNHEEWKIHQNIL